MNGRVRGKVKVAVGSSEPEVVRVALALPAVASLGTRPTVDGTTTLLEAHLFDFGGDLYGREIEVEFVAKLRDEERFATLAALAAQMQRDAVAARQILNA